VHACVEIATPLQGSVSLFVQICSAEPAFSILSICVCAQTRIFSYADTQRYRLGGNYLQLPINSPKCPFHNNHHDGAGNMVQRTEEVRSALFTARARPCNVAQQRTEEARARPLCFHICDSLLLTRCEPVSWSLCYRVAACAPAGACRDTAGTKLRTSTLTGVPWLQVNYFPSRHAPAQHAAPHPVSQKPLSGKRERMMIAKENNFAQVRRRHLHFEPCMLHHLLAEVPMSRATCKSYTHVGWSTQRQPVSCLFFASSVLNTH
jgi:Catalase